jgi:hypothetical protein
MGRWRDHVRLEPLHELRAKVAAMRPARDDLRERWRQRDRVRAEVGELSGDQDELAAEILTLLVARVCACVLPVITAAERS